MGDCISEKLELFDQETMNDNAQGLIDFISGLEGWDGNEDVNPFLNSPFFTS